MENLNLNDELSTAGKDSQAAEEINRKLDELAVLFQDAEFDNGTLQEFQRKFNGALRSAVNTTALRPYSRIPRNGQPDEEELEQLLFIDNLDKRKQRKVSASRIVTVILRIVIAVLFILLGFGMIIMPAPPYFEMFTLFYLNPNDGVTIMDVISLIVAFIGVYLLITSITKIKRL